MSRIADLAEARVEDADAKSWQCESCDKMIEDHQSGRWCRSCAEYWKSVDEGLFDRYYNED